jgi:hypothetical protein
MRLFNRGDVEQKDNTFPVLSHVPIALRSTYDEEEELTGVTNLNANVNGIATRVE